MVFRHATPKPREEGEENPANATQIVTTTPATEDRMRLATPTCPDCRERAVAALETIPITMAFVGDPREGPVRYGDGASNVLDWNQQRPVVGPGGRPLVVCVNGHQWETIIDAEHGRVPPTGQSAQLSPR